MIVNIGKFLCSILFFFIVLNVISLNNDTPPVQTEQQKTAYEIEIENLPALTQKEINIHRMNSYRCMCRNLDNPDERTNWAQIDFFVESNTARLGQDKKNILNYIGTSDDGYDYYLLKEMTVGDGDMVEKSAKLAKINKQTGDFTIKIFSLNKEQGIITYSGRTMTKY